MPEQMQFPFMLWTRRVIAALIEREFGVQLSLRSISSYPAVSNQGLMRFMIYNGGMNAQRLICFMHRLIKDNDRKVFLILDNLRVHHARKVRAWIARHATRSNSFSCRLMPRTQSRRVSER